MPRLVGGRDTEGHASEFAFCSGMALPPALAAPLGAGMMFWATAWPSRHRFPEGPPMVFWVAVMAWTSHESLQNAKVVMDDLDLGAK